MTVYRGTKAGFLTVPRVLALLLAVSLAAGSWSGAAAEAFAQPAAGGPPERGGRKLSPEQMKAMEAAKAAAAAGQQPGGQPQAGATPENKDKKPEGAGEKKEGGDDVKRPDAPPKPPDPNELKVALDEHGNVPPFNFIGQPWPDVMQWLATLSKSSLDWQKFPSGYLNLTTQRSYKLDEVHDLINQALSARGYTSIQSGEVLRVFKIGELDPAAVRQVTEEDLYSLKRYDFAKTSFVLPSEMDVDKAKEDVKQVLSPNAKVFPMVTTRKLLIMDSVANLRTVSELLNQERMIEDGRIVPKNFPLKYARPEQVIDTLYVILGIDPKNKPAQTDPQAQAQRMQMMQQMQQMQQQGGGRDMSKMLPKDAPNVYLAFNRQLNSVMANAPPKEMKIIEQTIALLDVPYGGGTLPGAVNGNDGRTLHDYTLQTLDPENFVLTLKEIGGLSPYAEFKVDSKSRTLFALASEEDHKKISSLMDQFDGTGRQFEVIQLHRYPAEAMAATIYKLMAGQLEKKDENEGRRFYFDFYDRDRNEEKEKPQQGFGIDADIENNQLLMWANEIEMKRVHDLLVKMGELPTGRVSQGPVRFIEPGGDQPSAELLQQIKDAWEATGGNKLIIKAPPPKPAEPAGKEKTNGDKKDDKPADKDAKPSTDRATDNLRAPRIAAHFAQLDATLVDAVLPQAPAASANPENAAPSTTAPAATPPPAAAQNSAPATSKNEVAADAKPSDAESTQDKSSEPAAVTITLTDDGRIMLSSPDTAALDRMEDLISQLSPPDKRYKVFPIKSIPVLHMYWDLTDYYKEELKEENDGYTRDWYGFMVPKGKKDNSTGLARRKKLMITYDVPSNSILVANASPGQLAEIDGLIKEFDKPAPADSAEMRQTASIKVYFSRPSVIAAAIKEVYRDLLSSKDKEFDRGEGKGNGERSASQERVTILSYGGGGGNSGSSDKSRPGSVKVGFDGALSLGADDVSNVLIVSAQKGIFDDIVRMVRELDNEAAPKTTVQVHHVNGNVSAAALQKALSDAVGTAWLGNRPEQTGTNQAQPQNDQRRDRDRDRGDRRRGNNNNDGNDNSGNNNNNN